MFKEILERICRKYTFYPRKYQLHFAEVLDEFIVNEVNKPIFVRLPCGYGKTLIGLLPFTGQNLAGEYPLSSRLIYVLPTRALINFFAKTAKQLMERIGLQGVDIAIEHGETHTSPHYFKDVIITTLDTFFYVYTKKAVIDNHLEFPAGCIATSTVVFDEAHMYQGGEGLTFIALKKLIQHLTEARIPVIIMTATMPEKLEKYLLEGTGKMSVEYGLSGLDEKYESNEGKKEYDVRLGDELGITDDVDIANIVKNYKRALMVFNTVSKAQKTYRELKDKFDNVILLHSRLCRVVREK
ncbi:MAG: CRISPR-associated helicase Cas3', partial [Candidatus Methanomethylicia archaeon]